MVLSQAAAWSTPPLRPKPLFQPGFRALRKGIRVEGL